MTCLSRGKNGMALVLSLGFLAVFILSAVFAASAMLNDLNSVKHLSYSTKAFYLAEAGVRKALYELRNNYAWIGEGPVAISWGVDYAGGDYETTVTVDGTKRNVVSTGYFPGKATMLAKRAIEAVIDNPPPPSWFYNNAIVAAEEVELKGNWTVNGQIVYGEEIDPAGIGIHQPDANPLALLSFSQLRSMAESQIKENGQNNVYTEADIESGKPFPTSFWFNEADGIPNIVYVETNLELRGNIGTVGGFFVVAGDVITNPSAQADTTINGNGSIDGVVYTLGDFKINGGGSGLGITGGVWAKEEVELNGNATVSFSQQYMDAIEGLNIATRPQIISWKEKHG